MQSGENHIWMLMARTLSGEASNAERDAFFAELRGNEALQQQYESLKQVWHVQGLPTLQTGKTMDERVANILQRAAVEQLLPKKSREFSISKAWMSVAAILAVVVLAIWLWPSQDVKVITTATSTATPKVIETVHGSRSRNVLPDGSVVWLNAGSKMRLSPGFNETNREIILEGEGYFDVVKSSTPFIVRVHDITLTVLGTAFNVKYFSGDKTLETTLIRGSLKINRHNEKEVVLKPNEKLVIKTADLLKSKREASILNSVEVETIQASQPGEMIETAWVYNRLEFRGETFESLAAKIERWYNVKMIFLDEPAKTLAFNGSFEDETIVQAMEALQQVAPFNFKIKNNEILIRSSR